MSGFISLQPFTFRNDFRYLVFHTWISYFIRLPLFFTNNFLLWIQFNGNFNSLSFESSSADHLKILPIMQQLFRECAVVSDLINRDWITAKSKLKKRVIEMGPCQELKFWCCHIVASPTLSLMWLPSVESIDRLQQSYGHHLNIKS